jgi:hypothetical protein
MLFYLYHAFGVNARKLIFFLHHEPTHGVARPPGTILLVIAGSWLFRSGFFYVGGVFVLASSMLASCV